MDTTNSDSREITVAIINTYLAKATADYNSSTKRLNVTVYNPGGDVTKTLDLEDFPQIESAKKDDFLLVNWADVNSAASRKAVMKVMEPEIMTDVTVTKFSNNGTKVTKLTTGGVEYESAAMLKYDADTLADYNKTLLTNKTYNIYLDQYQNAIGAEVYSGTDNYVFIAGVNLNTSTIANVTADANAIFLDGTMKTIKVDVKETNDMIDAYNNDAGNSYDYPKWNTTGMSDESKLGKHNTWYLYTLDETNNVYTLEPVNEKQQLTNGSATSAAVKINSENPRVDGQNDRVTNTPVYTGRFAYGSEKSVFITVETGTLNSTGGANVERAITGVTGTYVNLQEVDITSETHASDPSVFIVTDSKQYIVGAVVIGENSGSNANYAYILGSAKSEERIGDTYYWEFEAAVDGEVKTLTLKTKYPSVINGADGIKTRLSNTAGTNTANKAYAHGYLFRLSYDADGYVTSATPFDQISTDSIINGTGSNATTASVWNTPSTNKVVRYMNYVGTNGDALELDGLTLYNDTYKGTGNDRGLILHPDCKYVVIQTEYTELIKDTYDNIESALSRLADYYNPDDNIKHFRGTISAVLDGTGRATFVVFDSLGNIDPDQNQTGPETTDRPDGEALRYNIGIAEVNAELAKGNDVVIAGGVMGWQPHDLAVGNSTVYITKGTHLYIDGNFKAYDNNANHNGISIVGDEDSELTVTGLLTVTVGTGTSCGDMDRFVGKATVGGLSVVSPGGTLNCEMDITGISGTELTVAAPLTINKDMTIRGENGTLASTSGAGTVTVNAHVDIYGNWRFDDTNVTEYNTLAVSGGTISGRITLGDGNVPGNNGRFTGTLANNAVVIYKNVDVTETINVPANTVLVVAKPATLGDVGKDAVLIVSENVEITGTLATKDIVLASSKTITLASTATVAEDAANSGIIKDASGDVVAGTTGATLTIENDTGKAIVTSSAANTANTSAVGDENKVNTEGATIPTGSATAPLPNTTQEAPSAVNPLVVTVLGTEDVNDLWDDLVSDAEQVGTVTYDENSRTYTIKMTKVLDTANASAKMKTWIDTNYTGVSDANAITKGFWFDLSGVTKLYQYKEDQDGTWIERDLSSDSLTLFRANNVANSPLYLSLIEQSGSPTAEGASGIIKVVFDWADAEATGTAAVDAEGDA